MLVNFGRKEEDIIKFEEKMIHPDAQQKLKEPCTED